MPYVTRGITVTRDHIEELRDHGPGACLTWNEETHQVRVVSPPTATEPSRMFIIGYEGLGEMIDHQVVQGREVTDQILAEDLSDIATDIGAGWPQVRAMNLQVTALRRTLADAGVYLAAPPTFQSPAEGLPQLTDHYRLGGNSREASVTVSFGFLEPVRITSNDADDATQPIADLTLSIDGTLTHLAISRLIASTVTNALYQAC